MPAAQWRLTMTEPLERQRIDKWLWAARFFKTRALAVQAIERGRVQVAGANVKPARELKAGELVRVRQGEIEREVQVRALSPMRGPAPVAQQLYEETSESLSARAQAAEARRLAPEPAADLREGRPTKRDRRSMDELRHGWGDRWSASLDDDPPGKP